MLRKSMLMSLLVSCTLLSASTAGAHNSDFLNNKKTVKRSPVDFASNRLTSNVELPHVPTYTGIHKFETGTLFPNADGGASYCLKLSAKEPPLEILMWYASALKQYGWKPIRSLISARSVGGMRKGLVVHICVRPSGGQYRSSIYIQYKLGKSGGGD